MSISKKELKVLMTTLIMTMHNTKILHIKFLTLIRLLRGERELNSRTGSLIGVGAILALSIFKGSSYKRRKRPRKRLLNLLTSFQGTLIAFKSDPEGQRPRLYDIVGKLQDYILLVNREILPNIGDLESKSTISKGDIPEMNQRSVSKALDISALDKHEVDKFIEELSLVDSK